MNCELAKQRWHDLVDDDGGFDAELDAHLASCEPCRRYAAEVGSVVSALDALGAETESIRSRSGFTIQPRLASPWRRATRALIRMAAVLAVAASAYFYFSWDGPTGPGEGEVVVERLVKQPPIVAARLGISLRGDSAKNMVAFASPTSEPNVQLFMLYQAGPRASSQDPS